jgi:hypothetical protein
VHLSSSNRKYKGLRKAGRVLSASCAIAVIVAIPSVLYGARKGAYATSIVGSKPTRHLKTEQPHGPRYRRSQKPTKDLCANLVVYFVIRP